MKLMSPVVGCLLLTCVVVHTCIRIEVLNAGCGYYLPRTDFESGNPRWRVAAEKAARLDIERRIAIERQMEFFTIHPEKRHLDEAAFRGPPYSAAETALLASELDENRRRSALRAWVGGMGILQYLLAPAAVLWAVQISSTGRSCCQRLLAGTCVLLNLICIALMFYRAYWSSLGL